MTINIQIQTSLTTLEKLHQIADDCTAKTVKIDVQVLQLLLIDHHVLFRALSENSSFKIKEPRNREKL